MVRRPLRRVAICLLFLAGCSETVQEASTVVLQDNLKQTRESDLDTVQVTRLIDQMNRVQESFDELDNSMPWTKRVAFVASVSEIRKIRPTDQLVGKLADGKTDVVVLQITAIGRLDDVELGKSTLIVYPIEEAHPLWEHFRKQGFEMVFEYHRIGKSAYISKFGC